MRSILLTLFLCFITALGRASEKITYEDFVMLERAEQIKVIELIHQYLIAFETQTFLLRDTPSSQTTSLKNDFHTYKKILNYFISSAYAENASIPENFNNKKCYYAGWISLLKEDPNTKTTYCLHPKRIQDNLSDLGDEAKKYFKSVFKKYKDFNTNNKSQNITVNNEGTVTLASANNNCNTNENIICNPKIYGTHTEGSEQVGLCVVSAGNYGLNASYACDKAVRHLKDSVDLKNKYDEHMNSVIESMLTTPSASENDAVEILYSMYDTCLCKGDSEKTNQAYSERIFSSRTCAGILSHTKSLSSSIISACKSDSSKITDSNAALYDFILKADSALEKHIVNIQNIPFPDRDNKTAHRQKVEEIFKADEKEFDQYAQPIYSAARDAGLCATKTAAAAAAADNNSSFVVTPKDYLLKGETLYNILDVDIKDKGAPVGVSAEMKGKLKGGPTLDLSANNKQLLGKTPEKSTKYKITYKNTDPIISNQFTLAPPELKCTINKSDGSSASEKMITVTLPTLNTIKGYTFRTDDLVKPTIKQAGASFTANNENKLSGKLADYKKSQPINASGTIKIGGIPVSFKCDLKAEANTEDPKKVASCNLELTAEEQSDTSYSISTKIKYFEDVKKSKEITSPAAADSNIKKLKAHYDWFDLTKPMGPDEKSEEVSESPTRGSLEDIETSDAENNSETAEQAETQTEAQKLATQFKRIEGTASLGITSGLKDVSKLPIQRKITAVLNLKDGDSTVCEASSSVIIDRIYQKIPNNSPAQSNPINTNIVRPQGGAFEMQH